MSETRSTEARARVELVVPNEQAQLDSVRSRIQQHLRSQRVDDVACYAVDLALEELGGNVLRYGYDRDQRGELRIEIALSSTLVHVVITDDARPFDPTQFPPSGSGPRSIRDAPVGGRGIAMVRRSSVAMRHRRDLGWNRLEIDILRAPPRA